MKYDAWDDVETEVFLVIQNRSDGTCPKVVKSDGKLHHLEEDARKHHAQEDIGPYYGVYRALIRVTNRVNE